MNIDNFTNRAEAYARGRRIILQTLEQAQENLQKSLRSITIGYMP